MNRRQLRGPDRIAKSRNRRSEHTKILITAEGATTEPLYFEKLTALLNTKAVRVIRVSPIGVGRDPLRVVKEAVRLRDQESRRGDPFDAVWCVVDVDEHANLPAACTAADRSDVDMAISSPCFEIWLLWHYEDRTAWVDEKTLSRLLKRRGFSGKKVPHGFPYGQYPAAMERAARCGQVKVRHSPPNPHSSVPALISAMLAASTGATPK